MRRDRVAKCFDCPDGFVTTFKWDEEFTLELLAARRREVQLEVRQALVPGADGVELVGAGFGWMAEDGMEFAGCQGSVKKRAGARILLSDRRGA